MMGCRIFQQCISAGVDSLRNIANIVKSQACIAAILAGQVFACQFSYGGERECKNAIDQSAVASCVNRALVDAEKKLKVVYEQALNRMPDSDQFDLRKGKKQLIQAQAAWLIYRNQNCAYVGGLEGGNNRWVSFFASQCSLTETNARIKFLGLSALTRQSVEDTKKS